ncbi:hypothetical protein EIN_185820 [Entamoeba invadens IP1]|uniref:hypothetical protein n=1 Tax=Entamoeba invadens IP1 TaxID=370355 RepID=UPI0002C3DFDC|nr:hypothetical protein EIN_185820 [Entamoeba invadens IP1]ELP94175.1 hypothetical protein EIN_185820 [Entamoeba invadens IP1]|eukprot:XP_004260946.1 hypothetical protein EIN_185820 [Entamoeba invadens IP1]
MQKFKLCMLGEMGVGKTCIVKRYLNHVFDSNTHDTVGCDFLTKVCQIGKKKIELSVWDTAGSEKFRSMLNMYYRNISSCMIVYDITSRLSFEKVEEWYNTVQKENDMNNEKHVIVMIVAAKIDLAAKREVTKVEGENLAQRLGCLFTEVTSVSGDTVEVAFQFILDNLDLSVVPEEPQESPDFSEQSSCC